MTTDNTDPDETDRRGRRSEPPPRNRVPGRKTRPAYTRQRRVWYGMGETGSDEKSTFERFLHDVPYVFAELLVFGFPMLAWAFLTGQGAGLDITGQVFVCWAAMTGVATAIHTGLVRPLATDTLGWISITPALVGLRLAYYNLGIALAVYGGVALAALAGYPLASIPIAAAVGGLSMLALPRLAEVVARRRG